ncbi:50S ribosomal protein L25/general stress protein Ctc [Corynebacterium heidelbergense]|uniref:Large ribosomal subunit protein bL25 n=1 Tax=Corynebacterium heidelbergense TaxID=2055947 RepID=A0A364VAI7_9CORY|nr:50S ribosomal protein L25/general stress protein Ctc [Corynebacterium heidelbergense]RAV31448.1 50S ribosomal protein L25 [Corynebacterium heidelbergense]RAV33659.1 50S ribosomal protein L25 [Corynebacterium heidelbergense]WCZ37091.1 General stress protein CTC [Corynebacterium heidelbergense]
MSHVSRLKADIRHEFGKGASRRLRKDFRVPAVVYGHGEDPLHVHVDILELQAILRNDGVNAVLELEVEGEDHLVMIKTVDQNVLTLDVDHADFLYVKRGEKVEVDVPVVYEGEPAPGALVTQDADVITILADVMDIPEEITIDVEGMEIGHQVLASDVKMPSNSSLVSEPETLIINIVEPAEEELPEPESGEGETVIGEDGEVTSAPADEEEPEATEAAQSDES